MAERTNGSTEIDATPKEVMAVITDFDAYPEWAEGMKETEVLKKDKQGRGTQVRFSVSSFGLSDTLVFAYTYQAGDKGVSWKLVEAKNVKDLEGSYDLEDAGGSTKVTYELSMEPAIPVPGLVKRQIEKRMLRSALDGLKKRVEG
jgi:ribosome-associated toxin RatA of RatAB toxin-antitoxin module